MKNIPVYCVIRTDRDYNYTQTTNLELHQGSPEYSNQFAIYWNDIFKKKLSKVKQELRHISFDSIKKADFDKVYWNLQDFFDDYKNIKNKTLIYMQDDDDLVVPDIASKIKQNYKRGFNGLVWGHLRLHGMYNFYFTDTEIGRKGLDDKGNTMDINFNPFPFIQSNHNVTLYPIEKNNKIGTYIKELDKILPINHSCINWYLFQTSKKFIRINEILSVYNSTPASTTYIGDELNILKHEHAKEWFESPETFYKYVKKFTLVKEKGCVQALPQSLKNYITKTKNIFKDCL